MKNMKKRISILIAIILLLQLNAQASSKNLTASWYSTASLKREGTWKTSQGRMANGQLFNENALTCACRVYPLNSIVKVTNLSNNKSVIVKVTDRIGKRFANTRIDLSKKAFQQIAQLKQGIVKVKVELVK